MHMFYLLGQLQNSILINNTVIYVTIKVVTSPKEKIIIKVKA
jgi:hypothetical protein